MAKAMNIKVGNPLRKLVLIKLADNANDKGECWPSYQHIADQCEIDRSTVRRHIKDLEKDNLLTIENRTGANGCSSNLYILTLDGGKKPSGSSVGTGSTPVGTGSTPVGTGSTPPVGTESTRTSHSFEPVNEPVNEPKDPLSRKRDDGVNDVLEHLNAVTGSKYRATTQSHAKEIRGRLDQGHTVTELRMVIDYKAGEWLGDPKMSQYLRPQTLFNAGKFDGYLTAAKAKAHDPLANLSAVSRKNAQNLAGGW